MGCDIHMVLEKRTETGWLGMHSFNPVPKNQDINQDGEEHYTPRWGRWAVTNRNYERFGAMAGVRTEGPEPRGLPDDISELTRYETDRYGADGHSHSWLYAGEFIHLLCAEEAVPKNIKMAYTRGLLDGGDNGFYAVHDRYIGYLDDASPNDYRVVFWFDN